MINLMKLPMTKLKNGNTQGCNYKTNKNHRYRKQMFFISIMFLLCCDIFSQEYIAKVDTVREGGFVYDGSAYTYLRHHELSDTLYLPITHKLKLDYVMSIKYDLNLSIDTIIFISLIVRDIESNSFLYACSFFEGYEQDNKEYLISEKQEKEKVMSIINEMKPYNSMFKNYFHDFFTKEKVLIDVSRVIDFSVYHIKDRKFLKYFKKGIKMYQGSILYVFPDINK
jgi:hypothetical protein